MSVLKRLFGDGPAESNLRIIITRHGERADLALGPGWVNQYQRTGGRGAGVSYLARRSDFNEWNFDPPLTITGARQSKAIGRKLMGLGYAIDYCYSSPAYRSIQTAENILEGQGRKGIPINVDTGLFECPAWYVGTQISFIPPEELAMDRNFNVDPSYTPIFGAVDLTENEKDYYQRSRQFINAIVNAHQKQGGTILLSGHAGSIETITRGILGRRARPSQLEYQAGKVNYCNFAIVERDANTRKWSVHFPSSSENPTGGQRPMQSSIPLYSATSHYISSHPLMYKKYNDSTRHNHRHRACRHHPPPPPLSRALSLTHHHHHHPNQYH